MPFDIIVRENGTGAFDIVVDDVASSNYVAPVGETVSLSEALASRFVGHHGVGETVDLDEDLEEFLTLSAIVYLDETVTTAEGAAQHLNARPQPAEVLGLTDVIAPIYSGRVSVGETDNLTEQVRGGNLYEQDLPETVDDDEDVEGEIGAVVGLLDSPVFGEGLDVTTDHAFSVALFEAVTLNEARAAVWGARTGISEDVDLAEDSALGTDNAEHLLETVGIVESLRGRKRYAAAIGDSAIGFSEALDFGGGPTVRLAETITVSANVVSRRALHVAPAETVTLSETRVSRQATVEPLVDLVDTVEDLASEGVFTIPRAEVVALAEQLASRRAGHQGLADTVTLGEATAHSAGGQTGTGETVSVVEVRTTKARFHPPRFKEGFLVFERAASSAGMGSELADGALLLAEARAAHYGARARVSEGVGLGDALDIDGVGGRPLGEGVAFSEAGVARVRRRPDLAESVALGEALSTRGVHHRTFRRRWPALAEQLVAQRGPTVAALSETVALSEAQLGRRRVAHQLNQTITLAESLQVRVSTRFRAKEGYLIFEGAR